MKRSLNPAEDSPIGDYEMKKRKGKEEEEPEEILETGFHHLDENLLFEVLQHLDAQSLATAACVSKQWHKTAYDERLWEMICTRHWASNAACGGQQLRSVVLALGGFRRLHSLCILPLTKPSSSTSLSSPLPPVLRSKPPIHWGKDEVQLSLSLLSVGFFGKMSVNNRGR